VRTAVETFVPNPKLDVAAVIGQLGVGEALVSTLQDKGVPMPVEKVVICPPRCRMGAITPEERASVRGRSPVGPKYDKPVNRESAYEILGRRSTGGKEQAPAPEQGSGLGQQVSDILFGTKRRQGMVEAMAKQAARTVGSQVGRQILRGVLGGILGGARRR
jgi:DNA double-strand break repair helicase HerA and related ATPase